MTDVIKFGKKFFTVGVVITTIIWSLGVALLVPAVASAATCPTLSAGDMIKVTGKPAIYAVNNDLKVLYFPSGDEFKSWRPTYGGYVSVTQACFDSLSVPSTYPGAVNYHSGSYVVKRPSSDQLYVVEPNNTLAKITVDAAKALYGTSYKVMTVADTFWPHYVNRGTDVTEAKAHPGMLVSVGGTTYYVNSDNKTQTVSETGMTANGFQTKFVRTLTASAISGLTTGDAITAEVKALTDKTQSGGVTTPPIVTGGALTVSLAADNPAAKNIADGSAYNDVLKLNLTAGSNGVKVNGVTLTRTGLTNNTNISGVSVWDKDGNRHGDVMSSLTSDNKVTISFAKNPILVAAGGTETLLVRVNISASAGSGLVGFNLAVAGDMATDGTVSGAFPVQGSVMNIVDGSSSLASTTIAYQSVGGITNTGSAYLTAANANLEIGQLQKEIGKFKFTEATGYEDVVISKLTFYMEGSLQDKDLTNFKVYAPDGSVLGTGGTMVDRYVTVNFANPYTLPKSTNKTLSLKADIADGSTHYFRVHIQNDYDVMMKGITTGFYNLPGSFTDQYDTDGWFAMKAGSLTINKAATSLSGNVSAGASSVVLGQFEVKAVGENMELRKMGLGVALAGSAGKYLSGNVTVRDKADGTVYLTVAASGAAVYSSSTQYNLSSYVNINSGETKVLEVLGNIDSNATSGVNYQVGIGNFYAKRMSTLDFKDNLPTSGNTSTQGNQLTVNTTSLTCNKDTSMGNVTRSTGANTVIGQYICTAGTSEDVRLTGVNVYFGGIAGAGGLASTNFQNLAIYDAAGTTQLGSTLSTVASSSNSFSFDLTIPKNATKVLQLKAFITSGASGTVSSSFYTYNYTGKDSGTSNTGVQIVGQNVAVGNAAMTITAVSDATTISKIYGPGQTDVQLGKWKFSASNDKVTLNKVTFQTTYSGSRAAASTLGTYGSLALYDGAAKLGDANYVAGNVVFTGLTLPIEMDSYKVLTLKGSTNASGVITSNTTTVFSVKSNSNTDMEARSAAGAMLAAADINSAAASGIATSTSYIFHDAYPTVVPVYLGTSLAVDTKAPIFKYTVTNSGTRDLRLGTTTVSVSVTGLTVNSGATASGTIGGWKLYEDNGAGGLGSYIAATSSAGVAAGTGVATSSGYADTYIVGSSATVDFGITDDQNALLDNFLISPGASRTFIVTADTTHVFDGKTTGMVTVSGKIGGTTGWSGTAWNTGNLAYFYTPAGSGASETSALSASDSYDVSGSSLSKSL